MRTAQDIMDLIEAAIKGIHTAERALENLNRSAEYHSLKQELEAHGKGYVIKDVLTKIEDGDQNLEEAWRLLRVMESGSYISKKREVE